MVSKNDRLINYVIDSIAVGILQLSLVSLIYDLDYFLLTILPFFLYYFIMEVTLNRTLGKLVTKTKVVSVKGKRPNPLHIFVRTFMRTTNPIDIFSYLMGKEQGTHDVLSRTRLVKVDVKNELLT
jgi:uncharacterized RDD family membrane protein YckC